MKEGIAALRKRQTESLGYLLICAGQQMNDLGLVRVREHFSNFRPREAHTRLLPFLAEESAINITELAARVGVTKQAIQPLVADLVGGGYLRRAADPSDGRTKRLFLTRAGLTAMNTGTGVLEKLEQELTKDFSTSDLKKLKSLLRRLLESIEHERANAE